MTDLPFSDSFSNNKFQILDSYKCRLRPMKSSIIEIQTLHTPSKTCHTLSNNVATPNTTKEIGGRRAVLILGLAIEGDTF
jgi:hypothetical protein